MVARAALPLLLLLTVGSRCAVRRCSRLTGTWVLDKPHSDDPARPREDAPPAAAAAEPRVRSCAASASSESRSAACRCPWVTSPSAPGRRSAGGGAGAERDHTHSDPPTGPGHRVRLRRRAQRHVRARAASSEPGRHGAGRLERRCLRGGARAQSGTKVTETYLLDAARRAALARAARAEEGGRGGGRARLQARTSSGLGAIAPGSSRGRRSIDRYGVTRSVLSARRGSRSPRSRAREQRQSRSA